MKKVFRLENLDCANCAQKMENGIKKLEGVQDCTVSFMSQKMTLTADDGSFDEIVKKAVKLCRKIEPDCVIVLK
ncbi:heavy metal-associated domain-containing protein [Ruminococcus sp. Marseille-P6503]|uniref:cation transporter n=1 Tax=Ruminococcus sp. Marseille-P6503 TaxID=2364796 RepID=UPI000F54B929|nr:heavy metal-associated domain-containing protein [Ruminococcus sp. Marseille-P6503]